MDLSNALKYAINEIEQLQINEEFILKDLFKGYQWNRIKKSDRLKLGTMFLNYVDNDAKLILLQYTKSGQKVYRKISDTQ